MTTTTSLNPTNATIGLDLASQPPRLNLCFKKPEVFEAFERQLWTFGVFFVELPQRLSQGTTLTMVLRVGSSASTAPLPAEVAYPTAQGTALRVDLADTRLRDALRQLNDALNAPPSPPPTPPSSGGVDLMQLVREAQQRTAAPKAEHEPPELTTPVPETPLTGPSQRTSAYWLGGRGQARRAQAPSEPNTLKAPSPAQPSPVVVPARGARPMSRPVGSAAPLAPHKRAAAALPSPDTSPSNRVSRAPEAATHSPQAAAVSTSPIGTGPLSPPPRNAPERARALSELLERLGGEQVEIGEVGPAVELLERAARCEDALVKLTAPSGRRLLIMLSLGAPLDVQVLPSPEASSLEHLLHEAGKLTAAQVAQARERVERDGVPIEQALIACRFVGHEGLGQGMTARVSHLLLQALALRGGTLTYAPTPLLPYRVNISPVSLARLAARSISDRLAQLSVEALEATFASYQRHVLERVEPPPVLIDELRLTDRQHTLLADIDGERAVWEVLKESRLSTRATLEALGLFMRLRLIRVGALAARGVQASADVERLRLRYREVTALTDPFEVLGLHWSVYDAHLEATWSALIHELRPEAWPDNATDELVKLRDVYDRAYAQLRTSALRGAWRRANISHDQRQGALDLYLKQVEMFLYRRDAAQARDACLRALELNPGDRRARGFMRKIDRLEATEAD